MSATKETLSIYPDGLIEIKRYFVDLMQLFNFLGFRNTGNDAVAALVITVAYLHLLRGLS